MSFNKGQASIELILLLVVILLLVQTIIIPSRDVAKKSAEDVSSMAIVRSQAQKLANAIELVDSSASGAKQTIHLMIPQHSYLFCSTDGKSIEFEIAPLLEKPIACDYSPDNDTTDSYCGGKILLNTLSSLTCDDSSLSIMNRLDESSGLFYTLTILKDASGITVSGA